MIKNNIQIVKGFQTSVNIAYDLHNDDKVKNFIPTISSMDIIEDVLLSIAPNSVDRSRILIGAYGRGKSHIILVLLSMLFKKDKRLYGNLLEKMKIYNPELYEYANEYLESSHKILPIVVSGSSSSLTQSFLFALQQALNNENLSNIMPDTHFKASLNVIECWKLYYPETYKRFLEELNVPIDDYLLSLEEYNVDSYETFVTLYPKLTAGSVFNPFLGFDVVELYEKVVDKLSDCGYDGVYIVYDEFSKYLESSISNATISDIKLLQDFAEKCARSGKKQMHLMLICHKDIANYIDGQLPKEKVDGWRGVSGRFKHVNLHNNFSQMYEIISEVIKKDPKFWKTFLHKHSGQFEELLEKYTANGLIDDSSPSGIQAAIYGCYPLHPVSMFILPRLSEKVAQNERTLFTFLSSEDKHTLSSFLQFANDDFPILTPDYIYDYFEPLFRKEPYTSDVHKIYRITANVLQKVKENSIHAKIIKLISLIYIIEQFEKLPPIYDVIVDAYRAIVDDTKIISEALLELLDKDCIVYLKRSNNYLKLKESSGVDIPQEIKKKIESNRLTLNVRDILNNTSFENFMYPTRYNDEHEIIRYFNFLFISSEEFWNVSDWELKISNIEADGIVYAIIPDSIIDIEKIRKALSDGVGKNERIVFCLPKHFVEIEKIAFEYRAVLDLKLMAGEDDLLRDEYDIYVEDLEEVISAFVHSFARPETGGADYFHNGVKKAIYRKAQMSALLSEICETIYPYAPIINNESINKNTLPTVAINSRSKLIAGLLNPSLEVNLGLVGNGQDVSIMRGTLLQTGILEDISSEPKINLEPEDEHIRHMLHTIQQFFMDASINGSQNMGDLYERLTSPHFGIGLKVGVVPIYIATVLHLYRNHIVIKKGVTEQKLTPDLLNMINANPTEYFVVLENWNEDKASYISQLEILFQKYIHEQEKSYNNFTYIVSAMCRWYMSLPKYAKEMTKVYNGIEASDSFKNISASRKKFMNSLKQIDINPREYLFEKLFEIFGYSEFNVDVIDNITQAKAMYDEAIGSLLSSLIYDVRYVFANHGNKNASLTSIIRDWYTELKESTLQHLFDYNENKILELMKSITNDEKAFVQRLAKAVTALRVEDWNEKIIISFIESLKRFKQIIEEYNSQEEQSVDTADTYKLVTVTSEGKEIIKSFSKSEYSSKAKLLYNDIMNSLDEMGQSISDQEKRQVLFEILEKLC